MPLAATPARRRLMMVALLALAIAGGVIRHFAADPSTLRDFGSLLLVLWLPVVGNLIGWLLRKLPWRQPPPMPDFEPDTPFTPHLQADVERVELPPGWLEGLPAGHRKGLLMVGTRGYTVRVREPIAQVLATDGNRRVELELLRPDTALPDLPPGTAFHWLVGSTAVAKGRVAAA
ncbi:MAG TPA: hypothetical protein VEA40_24540 [Ramlibacter sp.]|nr:hypothetical protein [Ramlibacter sp.]